MLYWPHTKKLTLSLIVLEKKLSNKIINSPRENTSLLPHRYPFALVDKVIEHIPGNGLLR